MVFVYFISVWQGDNLFLLDNEASLLRYFVCRLALLIGGLISLPVIVGVGVCFYEAATTVFSRFTPRRVGWWTWLPENDAAGDFKPVWSIILAGSVLVMPLVLLFRTTWSSTCVVETI